MRSVELKDPGLNADVPQPELTEAALFEALCAGHVLVVGGRAKLVADRIVRSEGSVLQGRLEVRFSAKMEPDAWELF